MASQGQHGGGNNNSNKREKRVDRGAPAPSFGSGSRGSGTVEHAPGAVHIIGNVPAPTEETSRPRSR